MTVDSIAWIGTKLLRLSALDGETVDTIDPCAWFGGEPMPLSARFILGALWVGRP